ncbi:MAG TPA: sulfatase-like hydrolase/transferase [Gemmataceae bacterium]|jgi:arylsulfatase A-like enzyme|nr:sulfatase-like hydrolase/transferase [Gemmataceae bacterium]
MNVVVVAAHGLGCHWLSPYGNSWVATSAVDALAAESTVFDRHFADEPTPMGFRRSCPTEIHQSFRAAGITANLIDDRKERIPDDRPWSFVWPTNPAIHATPADALSAAVKMALDQRATRSPWLLWIETDRLLPPWDLELETYQQYAATSGGFAEEMNSEEVEPTDEPTPGPFVPDDDRHWHQLHNSFAAAVTSFDIELAAIFSTFREHRLDQSTALILTSGYGWPLGEHGIVGPRGSRMHEDLVHVPLIVRLPGEHRDNRRVSAFTQVSDLGPTLLDLFGIPPGGRSLVPLMTGAQVPWRDSARTAREQEHAIRTDEWAFLPANDAHPARLYRKPDDIWEVNDIAATHLDECDRLAALLDGPKEPTS